MVANRPLHFTVTRSTGPTSDERRARLMTDPPFGHYHTDHMVSITYTAGRGWHDARVMPYGPIELDPSAIVLHYAQEIFEGLKAYRWPDGSIVSFRPEANAARLQRSAARTGHPRTARRVIHGIAPSTHHEDVPSSVELRWRSGEHQAALTSSLCTTGPTGSAVSRSSAARTVGRCR